MDRRPLSLKTNDRALANRRLSDLRKKIANLTLTDIRNATFEALAQSWLEGVRHGLKPASFRRREVCIKGLTPFFNLVPIRNISATQCEKLIEKRGCGLSASSFVQELDTLRLILDYAVKRGLLLDNPASSVKRRRVVTKKISIPTREQFQSIISAVRDVDQIFGTHGMGKAGADLVWSNESNGSNRKQLRTKNRAKRQVNFLGLLVVSIFRLLEG